MPKTIHMSLSVRGALKWSKKELCDALNWATRDDGSKFASTDELRNALMDELAQGREVIPFSKDCDNFDFAHGCNGHTTANSRRDIMPFDLHNIFTYHAPSSDDLAKYQAIRDAGKAFATAIVQNTAACADQSAAIRKVREAVMTANAAVALKGTA